ncbi:hypothetical protein [Actinospica robiniae]|uniref:hypothetical protein n=1 Tax=Actinospica robiniae TaxID=304901 RepID=UPI000402417F|nr:hypothetical protein [Actinospica robiniae]
MFFLFSAGYRKTVRRVEEGMFFCLRCEAECAYELRELHSEQHVFRVLPVHESSRMFVLCTGCGTAFDPECLDESSTAELAELEIEVPHFAYGNFAPRGSRSGRRSLSAHSDFRRH